VNTLRAKGVKQDFSFNLKAARQCSLFWSFAQIKVAQLRRELRITLLVLGAISVAGMTHDNMGPAV